MIITLQRGLLPGKYSSGKLGGSPGNLVPPLMLFISSVLSANEIGEVSKSSNLMFGILFNLNLIIVENTPRQIEPVARIKEYSCDWFTQSKCVTSNYRICTLIYQMWLKKLCNQVILFVRMFM